MSILDEMVANLSCEELQAVQEFTLTWTIFEARLLENSATFPRIKKLLETQRIDEGAWFADHFDYFVDRYVDEGTVNFHFNALNFRSDDGEGLVCKTLLGNAVDENEKLISCFAIVHRFRNNLFHGLKWQYELKDQLGNFQHSVGLLTQAICRIEQKRSGT